MTNITNITNVHIEILKNVLPILGSFFVISTLIPQIIMTAIRKETNDFSYISLLIYLASHVNMFIYGLLIDEWGFYGFSPFAASGVIILLAFKCKFDKKQISTLINFNNNVEDYLKERQYVIDELVNIIENRPNFSMNDSLTSLLIYSNNLSNDVEYKKFDIIKIFLYVLKIDERVTFETKICVFIQNILRNINNTTNIVEGDNFNKLLEFYTKNIKKF